MASEWIKDVICNGGTPVQQCEFCGRTHFTGSGYGMDEGELERLQKRASEAPSFFVQHNEQDGISYGQIEGTTYVWNCGCEKSEARLKRIEEWIWSHQHIVTGYIRKRLNAMKEEIDIREEMLKSIDVEP